MSALDARTRIIAAEVFAELTASGQATADAGPDRVGGLEKQVAELTARVEDLEKTAAAAPAPAAKRAARSKTTDTSE